MTFRTIIGNLYLYANEEAVISVAFSSKSFPDLIEQETPLLEKTKEQLTEYFAGKRTDFDLPLQAVGTIFQKQVWTALQTIPYGETRSYKQIADRIGNPKACRAVGLANNRNPIPIIIPCHRVIASDGKLQGYAGGLEIKERLLGIEKAN
ncbi:MAG: methylated-DNA--[protein]-cysteine S-methyltransferase [Bacteroidales bacterium]|nr:methylated-DNA--[protein]-cysteine S-methyltransferase [Bacteroidales bacterium]